MQRAGLHRRTGCRVVDRGAKYVVPGLDRGLKLLSLFSRREPELSLGEVVKRAKLPYATAYRLLHTLELHDLLQKTGVGFRLGPGILKFGFDYLSSMDLVEMSRPVMVSLCDATGVSANLGILSGQDVIYVAHVPSPRPLMTRLVVGSRLPAHSSSIGRLILGAMPQEQVRRLFRQTDFKQADSRFKSIDDLVKLVQRDWKRGYVITRGSYDTGVVAVAAPILDRSGSVVAGVNVSGPATSLDTKALEGPIRDGVCAAARAISSLLGFRDQPSVSGRR